jgi:hypothetical protein
LSSATPVPNALTSPRRPPSHGSSRSRAVAVGSPSASRSESSSERRAAAGPARVQPAVAQPQVADGDDLRAQEPRDLRVLPRRPRLGSLAQHDDEGIVDARRRGVVRRPAQQLAQDVAELARAGAVVAQRGRHGAARGRGVAVARGRAAVVLQHARRAVLVADDVQPRDRDRRGNRREPAAQLGLVALGLVDELVREHAGRDDRALAVGVGDEGVQRADALLEPCGEPIPRHAGEQPRHRVDPERLGAEAHALRVDVALGGVAQREQVGALEGREEPLVVLARRAVGTVGLVERGSSALLRPRTQCASWATPSGGSHASTTCRSCGRRLAPWRRSSRCTSRWCTAPGGHPSRAASAAQTPAA